MKTLTSRFRRGSHIRVLRAPAWWRQAASAQCHGHECSCHLRCWWATTCFFNWHPASSRTAALSWGCVQTHPWNFIKITMVRLYSRLTKSHHLIFFGTFLGYFVLGLLSIISQDWFLYKNYVQGPAPWLSGCSHAPLRWPRVSSVQILGADTAPLIKPRWGGAPHATKLEGHTTKNIQLCTGSLWGEKGKKIFKKRKRQPRDTHNNMEKSQKHVYCIMPFTWNSKRHKTLP